MYVAWFVTVALATRRSTLTRGPRQLVLAQGDLPYQHTDTMSADTASSSAGAGQMDLSPDDPRKSQALESYRKALKNHEQLSEGLKKRK